MTARRSYRSRLGRTRATTAKVALATAIGVGAVVYFGSGGGFSLPQGDSLPPFDPRPAAQPTAIAIPAGAQPMTVEHVHDGDTLFLAPANPAQPILKVRLIGVDTPELDQECHAETARDALRALLPNGSQVHAAHDVEPQDRYGRELLYVWDDTGALVNLELVRAGHGTALRVGQNDAHWGALQAAEASARSAKAGLWGAC